MCDPLEKQAQDPAPPDVCIFGWFPALDDQMLQLAGLADTTYLDLIW